MGLHPDLRGLVIVYWVLGPLCAVVGVASMALPFMPLSTYIDQAWIPRGFGGLMIGLGGLAFVGGPAFYRRASWVLACVPPDPVRLTLRVSWAPDEPDDRDYYADLRPDSDPRDISTWESHRVLAPKWVIRDADLVDLPDRLGEGMWRQQRAVAGLIDVPARVHRDPRPGGPVVVATDRGILWPLGRSTTIRTGPERSER